MGPVDVRAQFLARDLTAALAININRERLAARLVPIGNVLEVSEGCFAAIRKGLPLIWFEPIEINLEVHGLDYHHKVTDKTIPSGELTKWCPQPQTWLMDDAPEIQEARRLALKAYIRLNFENIPTRLAKALDENQSYLSEVLSGIRSFGEKYAKKLERLTAEHHLPPVNLFHPHQVGSNTPRIALEAELLEGFRRLSPERQEELVRQLLIEALRSEGCRPPQSPEDGEISRRRTKSG